MPAAHQMHIHKNLVNIQSVFGFTTLVRSHFQECAIFRLALQHVPKYIAITLMLLLYLPSDIQVTPKAGWCTLVGSDSLLILTLLSLHLASSHILLKAPSD